MGHCGAAAPGVATKRPTVLCARQTLVSVLPAPGFVLPRYPHEPSTRFTAERWQPGGRCWVLFEVGIPFTPDRLP